MSLVFPFFFFSQINYLDLHDRYPLILKGSNGEIDVVSIEDVRKGGYIFFFRLSNYFWSITASSSIVKETFSIDSYLWTKGGKRKERYPRKRRSRERERERSVDRALSRSETSSVLRQVLKIDHILDEFEQPLSPPSNAVSLSLRRGTRNERLFDIQVSPWYAGMASNRIQGYTRLRLPFHDEWRLGRFNLHLHTRDIDIPWRLIPLRSNKIITRDWKWTSWKNNYLFIRVEKIFRMILHANQDVNTFAEHPGEPISFHLSHFNVNFN